MKALMFPGQGSQVVGMGLEFYNNFGHVRELFSEADEILKFKISKMILEGPEIDLKMTQNTQPAIMLVSYSIFQVIKKNFNFNFKDFDFFLGHSLGEYSALVCANALSFKDAIYLLHERGKAMQEAVPVGQGAMLAILGSNILEVENYLKNLKTVGICEIANDNADGQVIVSGKKEKIKELENILKINKKKSILLPVSAPFHCALMQDAADNMKEKIKLIEFKNPSKKIISNVTSKEIETSQIKNLLIKQIYSKVRWRESIMNINKQGVNTFIEIGPGKVLSGLSKRIAKENKSTSINSVKDIELILNESEK